MRTVTVDCTGKETREINREIKENIAENTVVPIVVMEPGARHNLAVAILENASITFMGSVGYYCGGLSDGVRIDILGSAGWGVAEGLMSGTVYVDESAGNGAGAAMRGGTVVIKGDAGARAGASIKGGTLIIGGDTGYMTGFMGQKGTIIVCGNAEPGFGDSMYETVLFLGGECAELGSDTTVSEPSEAELTMLSELLTEYDLRPKNAWKKVVSGRKLWNFDKKSAEWRTIL